LVEHTPETAAEMAVGAEREINALALYGAAAAVRVGTLAPGATGVMQQIITERMALVALVAAGTALLIALAQQ
jgi:hypothetical protein